MLPFFAPRTIVGPHRRVAQPVRLCSGVIEWFIHLVSTNFRKRARTV
jgi:hypothetical protein